MIVDSIHNNNKNGKLKTLLHMDIGYELYGIIHKTDRYGTCWKSINQGVCIKNNRKN